MTRDDLIRRFLAERTSLLGYLRLLLPRDLVEDAYQETFLVMERKLESFDQSRDFCAWVRGIARLVALRTATARGRTRTVAAEELAERFDLAWQEAEQAGDPLLKDLPSLRDCLAKLHDQQRELVRRRYQLGLSLDEIAASNGRTANAVHVALNRIRTVLHQCIARARKAAQ